MKFYTVSEKEENKKWEILAKFKHKECAYCYISEIRNSLPYDEILSYGLTHKITYDGKTIYEI